MADQRARELKLTQYLNEAYGKEKQLETTLQAQIELAKAAARKTLQKRFQDHLKETKAQSRGLERRIKQLGGRAEAVALPGPDLVSDAASGVANVANRALAAAKGPVQALRGTSPADNLLRNVRDAVWNEAEEIAHYDAIEALAESLRDSETAKMAREFRRQEERMQKFLRGQISQLVKQVVRDEIPAAERRAANGGRSTRSRSTSRSAASRSSGSRSSSSRAKSSGSTSRASSSRGTSSRAKSSGSSSRAKSGGSSSRASSSRAKSGGSTSRAKSSGSTSRASSSRGTSSRAKSSGSSSRAKSSGSSSRAKSSGSSRASSSRAKPSGTARKSSGTTRKSGGTARKSSGSSRSRRSSGGSSSSS